MVNYDFDFYLLYFSPILTIDLSCTYMADCSLDLRRERHIGIFVSMRQKLSVRI